MDGPLIDSLHDAADGGTDTPPEGRGEPPPAGAAYIRLLVFAVFGVYMAFVTPIAISLAIRVDHLAPGHEEYLGYTTGVGGISAALATPLVGMLSDRTRSRLGRRRPFLISGTLVGVVALVVMAQAPTVPVLALGWALAQLGWGTIVSLLIASQADRLPEFQRGKVAALAGVVQPIAPIIGVLVAGGLTGNPLLQFLVPGMVGVLAVGLFVCLLIALRVKSVR
jgi:MFS family permease